MNPDLGPIKNFDGLNPFSAAFRRKLNAIAEAAYDYLTHRSQIVDRLAMQPPVPPGGTGSVRIAIGKITGVSGESPNYLYDAESVFGPKLQVNSATPANRPFGTSDILPAPEDSPCLLYEFTPDQQSGGEPEVILDNVREVASFAECEQGVQGVDLARDSIGDPDAEYLQAAVAHLRHRTADVILGSDVTTTSDTIGDVTGMSFTIGVGEHWTCEYRLRIGCDNTGGVMFAVTVPSGASMLFTAFGSTSAQNAFVHAQTTTPDAAIGAFCTHASTADIVHGSLTVRNGSTAGTVQLGFRSRIAGQESTVFADSYLTARRVK